ncbi:MAG: putative dipeptide-transport integral membrane protein ABC transporter DppB [Phycisphaerae bacterium]|nr:Oligopeptide transport system permease protein OppB [Phycisphaerales bacterium]MCK6475339.1 ABC transporter permease [Phycisphaerales bacterium]
MTVVRRLIQLPVVLLVIYTLTLALAWAAPGNPLDKPEGRRPPPEVEMAMRRQYNLDSFWSFYFSYLDRASGLRYVRDRWTGAAQAEDRRLADQGLAPPARRVFDLGPSLQYRDRTVNEIIGQSLPVSVRLGLLSILIALVIGLAAGVVGAWRPGSLLDAATLGLSLVGISLPTFVIGTVLLLIFPVWLGVGRVGPPRGLGEMMLPAVTLSLPTAAYIARLTRMGMIEQLSSDYVRTARAKGLPESAVVLRHALRNALLPVVSFLGPATAAALTGSFVVERVFSVPGLGQHFVSAVQNKDLFLIIGVVMIYGALLVLFNLASDLLYRWIDPRIE